MGVTWSRSTNEHIDIRAIVGMLPPPPKKKKPVWYLVPVPARRETVDICGEL